MPTGARCAFPKRWRSPARRRPMPLQGVPEMSLVPLSRLIVEPLVRAALLEDLGLAGDITSASVIPRDHRSTVVMAARQPGVIAGLDAAELAFALVDPE